MAKKKKKTEKPARLGVMDGEIAKKITAGYLRERRSLTRQYIEVASVDVKELPALGYKKNDAGGWDWIGIQPS